MQVDDDVSVCPSGLLHSLPQISASRSGYPMARDVDWVGWVGLGYAVVITRRNGRPGKKGDSNDGSKTGKTGRPLDWLIGSL